MVLAVDRCAPSCVHTGIGELLWYRGAVPDALVGLVREDVALVVVAVGLLRILKDTGVVLNGGHTLHEQVFRIFIVEGLSLILELLLECKTVKKARDIRKTVFNDRMELLVPHDSDRVRS